MSLLEALILGVVQGATEFLPVSSSGHLVLGQALLGLTIPGVAFEIAVHVATLVSVLIVYRGPVSDLIRGAVRRDRDAWRYLGMIVAATIPAAVVGGGFGDRVEALFEAPAVAAIGFLVTAAVLWSTRTPSRSPSGRAPDLGSAVLMGFAQAFALVPGVSRSGSTVAAGLWMGVDPREAAQFSFLMAIPAIAGAAVLKAPELAASGAGLTGGALVAGSAAAAVTGVLAIRSFVALLDRQGFHRFAYYLAPLGILFLVFLRTR